jgi:hypothetical protein
MEALKWKVPVTTALAVLAVQRNNMVERIRRVTYVDLILVNAPNISSFMQLVCDAIA